MVAPAIERSGPIEAWIIDDTSFPKKGRHSVGVTRQYSGQLGKQDNCQVAVSLSIANDAASLPVAYRLYLPQDWENDPAHRRKAGVPDDVVFKTKPMIGLDQIMALCDAGLPRGVVLMDAGYGAIEWPLGEDEPSKYGLSTFPESMPFDRMVQLTKMRWRIERDYLELKQELGLGHYEGRGWRGFHHHATLCIASYGFLSAKRATIPPSGPAPTQCATPGVPGGGRSRSAATATPETRAELDRHRPKTSHHRTRTRARAMSLLCNPIPTNPKSRQFITQ
jgi:SRSO17 transposase